MIKRATAWLNGSGAGLGLPVETGHCLGVDKLNLAGRAKLANSQNLIVHLRTFFLFHITVAARLLDSQHHSLALACYSDLRV